MDRRHHLFHFEGPSKIQWPEAEARQIKIGNKGRLLTVNVIHHQRIFHQKVGWIIHHLKSLSQDWTLCQKRFSGSARSCGLDAEFIWAVLCMW